MKVDLKQLDFIEPLLKSIILDIEHYFCFEFTATSLYRKDDPGVHGTIPLRGIDLSCKNEHVGIAVENYVNKKYQYDPDRIHMFCCLYHDSGSGLHLHIQIHPNTVILNQ